MVFADKQAFRTDFVCKEIRENLAILVDFLAEYEFEIHYRFTASNGVVDVFSWVNDGDKGAQEIEEGKIGMILDVQKI